MITLRIEGNEHIIRAFDKVADPGRHADLLDQIGSYPNERYQPVPRPCCQKRIQALTLFKGDI